MSEELGSRCRLPSLRGGDAGLRGDAACSTCAGARSAAPGFEQGAAPLPAGAPGSREAACPPAPLGFCGQPPA
eukprot:2977267-Pyramimonas_sp.AAC.1